MNSAEIKSSLRKIEFPHCAKDALCRIGQLIYGRDGRNPNIKNMDLALDLMSEFVFCEIDRKGSKTKSPFTAIVELQLLEVLYDYINSISNESARNSVFLTLFSGSTATLRLGILSKLVSIAIGTSCTQILNSASTWMQQLGNTSTNSCKLTQSLVNDYFILVPNSIDHLKQLPNISPQFTANFLTAIGELYFTSNKKDIGFPPISLLETIVGWVTDNSKLCIAAQTIQSALPPGAIYMEATTPFAGLLKWCVLAPIYNKNSDLYCQLHLSLLNSILEIPQCIPPKAISTQHLGNPMSIICRYINDLVRKSKCVNADKSIVINSDTDLQLCLDRYAQSVQVALSTHCVYGNMDDFFSQLSQLPQHKLLNIVMSIYKRSK